MFSLKTRLEVVENSTTERAKILSLRIQIPSKINLHLFSHLSKNSTIFTKNCEHHQKLLFLSRLTRLLFFIQFQPEQEFHKSRNFLIKFSSITVFYTNRQSVRTTLKLFLHNFLILKNSRVSISRVSFNTTSFISI